MLQTGYDKIKKTRSSTAAGKEFHYNNECASAVCAARHDTADKARTLIRQRPAFAQRLRECTRIDILEFAPHRNATG